VSAETPERALGIPIDTVYDLCAACAAFEPCCHFFARNSFLSRANARCIFRSANEAPTPDAFFDLQEGYQEILSPSLFLSLSLSLSLPLSLSLSRPFSLRTPFFSHGPATSLTSATFDGRQKWRLSLRKLVLSGGCARETPQFQENIGTKGHSSSEYVHPAPCIWRWRGKERNFWRKNGIMAREHSQPALVSSQTALTRAPRAARLPHFYAAHRF